MNQLMCTVPWNPSSFSHVTPYSDCLGNVRTYVITKTKDGCTCHRTTANLFTASLVQYLFCVYSPYLWPEPLTHLTNALCGWMVLTSKGSAASVRMNQLW